MEGRTNLLPKIGGYVSGDVRDCVVAQNNTIVMGDFVQMYNTHFTDGEGFENAFLTLNNIGYGQGGKYSYNAFEDALSDGTPIQIGYVRYSSNAGNYFEVTEIEFTDSGFVKHTQVVASPFTNVYRGIFYVKLGGDEFLAISITTPYPSSTADCCRIYKENGVWKSVAINVNLSLVDSKIFFPNENVFGVVAISLTNNRALWDYSSGSYKYHFIVDYDSQNDEITITSKSGYLNLSKPVVYDETEGVIATSNGYVYSVNGTTITQIASGKTSFKKAFLVSGKKYICFGANYYFFLTFENGDAVYGNSVFLTNSNKDYFKHSGLYVGFNIITSNNQYVLKANTLIYDDSLEQMFEGEVNDIYTYSASLIGITSFSMSDLRYGYIELFYATNNNYYGYTKSIAFQILDNNISPATDIVKVIRYLNAIHGVAKTSGTAGDTIQVYVPHSNS